MPLTDADLYEGFSKEKIERYNREVQEAYAPEIVNRTNRNIRNLSKEQWQKIQQDGRDIALGLSKLTGRDPTDPEVQIFIARQHAWIENFYPADADILSGLGSLYAGNPEFRTYYDQFTPGLADFLCDAMKVYAETALREK